MDHDVEQVVLIVIRLQWNFQNFLQGKQYNPLLISVLYV